MDHPYGRGPRLVEREPGILDAEATAPTGDAQTTTCALFERLSCRWMGRPKDEAVGSGPSEWDSDKTLVALRLLRRLLL